MSKIIENVPKFLVTKRLHFTLTLLLHCLIRLFSSKYLFRTSDTSPTSMTCNLHVSITCAFKSSHWLDV